MTTEIITFGCRLNAYESEVMADLARQAGLSGTVVINTCAVTAEAERQARQAIRKARRERPDAKIIVTGCAAQIDPERYAAMPEVDRVIGNREKLDAASFAPSGTARVAVADIMTVRETAQHLIGGFEGRARAFVEVQQGCDHRCTFCIIPFGRGPSRSVPLGPIVEQTRKLVAGGYRELVLTGVDITSWGADLPGRPTLGQLVHRLLAAVPELPRLRLTSLDPAEIDDALWRALAEEERLMPHLHLSLQAGDDLILKRMKRRHDRQDVVDFCARARSIRPDLALGADVIAGFPTETEAMFRNTLELIERCDIPFLHVFPYSERPGTPAARMPSVPVAERRARAARLRAAGNSALARFLERAVGRPLAALVEKDGFGRSEHYAPVRFSGSAEAGSVVRLRARASTGRELIADLAA